MPYPVTIFYAYAEEDELLKEQLDNHLGRLQRQNLVGERYNRCIMPGRSWAKTIHDRLNTATIILLLVSPDFLASGYCSGAEIKYAIDRHKDETALVVPVILRCIDWHTTPFAHLPCLPFNAKPVTFWCNRQEAFLAIAHGLHALIKNMDDYTQSDHLPSSIHTMTKQASVIDQRNYRNDLLRNVRTVWLDSSLQNVALIRLRLSARRDVVAGPRQLTMPKFNRPARLLPIRTRLKHVYNNADGKLLLLGEPGSGKTTLLLKLTRDLLNQAERDEKRAIPVIFKLSTWTKKRQILMIWLIEELYDKYNIPYELGRIWFSDNSLILILDGLDEIVSRNLSDCIEAINQFRYMYPLAPLIVTGRSMPYFDQPARLRLHDAIIIQPLTPKQVEDYLITRGEQTETLRITLQSSLSLQKLITNPLMFSVLAQVHQQIGDLQVTESQIMQQMFEVYYQRVIQHRSKVRYTPYQIKDWLCWVPKKKDMVSPIKSIQPDWLLEDKAYKIYSIVVLLASILVGGLVGYLSSRLGGVLGGALCGGVGVLIGLKTRYRSQWKKYIAIGVGLAGVLFGGLAGVLFGGWIESGLKGKLIFGFFGVLMGFFGFFIYYEDNLDEIVFRLISGLAVGVTGVLFGINLGNPVGSILGTIIGGAVGGIICAKAKEEITYPHDPNVLWERIKKGMPTTMRLGGGSLGMLILMLLILLILFFSEVLPFFLGFFPLVALFFGLLTAFFRPSNNKIIPNRLTRYLFYNILLFWLFTTLTSTLATVNLAKVFLGIAVEPVSTLLVGGLVGIITTLFTGGFACFQYILLRLILIWFRCTPWNYTQFLDHLAENGLLRKAGSNYFLADLLKLLVHID
jgi:eukaryotic-like serine/threonine-protein kinase